MGSDGRVVWANPAAVRLLDLEPGSPVPPEIPLLEGGLCELRDVEVHVTELGEDEPRWLLSLRDVSRRAQIMGRLNRVKAMLVEAEEITHLGSWEWDIHSNRVHWSDELFRIYGLEPRSLQITLEGFLDRVHPDDRHLCQTRIGEAATSGLPFRFDHRVLRPDGAIRVLEARGRVVTDSDGKPVRMYGTGFDVTELRREMDRRQEVEDELRRLNASLEEQVARRTAELSRSQEDLARARDAALEATRLKTEFLANVSHEIRTPLNGIVGAAELLRTAEATPEQRELLGTVELCAEGLLSLIDEILDLSGIEAGKLVLRPEPIDPVAVLEEAVELAAMQAPESAVELVVHVEPGVPRRVFADAGRLRQVLLNLLGNAMKFTERGEVVATLSGAGPLRFEVRDTGPGIAGADLPRLFEPFTQLDGSPSRRHGGTGLGLSICRRIVDAMGGRLDVESREGHGSLFWFEVEAPALEAPAASRDLEGVSVLVLEGHAGSRRRLVHMLRELGARAIEAADVAAAQALLDGADVALVDADVPDGLALVEAMAAEGRVLPLVLCQRRRAAPGRLVKPVRTRRLAERVASLLQARQEPPPPRPLLRKRILVAEDNSVNRRVTMRLLESIGCEVEVVENGRQALEALARGSFDAVLMDGQMPELDGYEATRRLRAEGHRIPVVGVTAHAWPEERERCLAAGMDDHLVKPVRLDRLREALERRIR